MTNGTPKLNAALIKARRAFPHIVLDKQVNFRLSSGRNMEFGYATLENLYQTLTPSLLENGLCLSHRVDGTLLVVTLRHESGEMIESVIEMGRVSTETTVVKDGRTVVTTDNTPDWKEYGKAITYATRYAVAGILGVRGEEDLDAPGLKADSIDNVGFDPTAVVNGLNGPALEWAVNVLGLNPNNPSELANYMRNVLKLSHWNEFQGTPASLVAGYKRHNAAQSAQV